MMLRNQWQPESRLLRDERSLRTPDSYVTNRGPARHKIIKIQDQDDFNTQVLKSKEPVVIDFFATWCGPCKMLLPRIEKIIEEHNGTIHLAKVDIDDNAEIAMEYGVSVVPELVLMKDGKVQGKMIGLQDEDKLKHFVSKLTEPSIEKK